jgi:tetratricopeptide (TPR) repeat protein
VIVLPALAALLLGAGADACGPLTPLARPDPEGAAAYREVGDAERAAGSYDTAAAAYRAAAERDPSDARARAALSAVCAERGTEGAYRRGLRLMDAGDREGAVAAFEEARAHGRDRSASLLEGINLYELGEDARARPLLAEAEGDPAHREAARFFLGLLAMRAGRTDDAAALFEASAADRRFGPAAADLARLARRDGRVVFSMLVDGGWDSNLDLTPDGAGAPQADAAAGLAALVRVAPWGDSGPFLRAAGQLREQTRYDAFDLAGGSVAAGWQTGRAGRYLLGEAGWDYRYLGGAPYLSAPRLLGAGRLAVGTGGSVGLTYVARWEDYLPQGIAAYSGLRHLAEADATLPLTDRAVLVLAWRGGLDVTRDPTLGWWEQGPRLGVRVPLGRDTRIALDLGYDWRTYDHYDAALGAARADRFLDAAAVVERELGDRWTLRASLAVRRATSNVPAFVYTSVIPSVGIAYTIGLL